MHRTHNFVAFKYKGYKERVWLKIEKVTDTYFIGTIINESKAKGLKYGVRKKFMKSHMSDIEFHK